MAFVVLGANSASGGYTVKNSLRFNAGSTDYLTRTPSVAGNRRTWTYSCWIKKLRNDTVALGNYTALLTAGNDGTEFYFLQDTGQLRFYYYAGGYIARVDTVAYFRDLSAWYHIVLSIDTTQATDTNRIKIYVNGTLQTLTSTTYPAQNTQMDVNNTSGNNIGRYSGALPYDLRNGHYYLAESYLIDGQQLDPTSFGETDTDTGIWKPKAYTGTYGTNGFYLQFKNSASLGTDSSGNGNTFTVNNLTSIDQTTDTPTNNFATMNALDNYYFGATFSEGNLKVATVAGNENYGTSNFGLSTGKWYWEVKCTSSQGYNFTGITDKVANATSFTAYSSNTNTISYYGATGGYVLGGGASNSYGNTYSTGDIIGVALDITNGKLYFSKNGTFQNSGDPANGTNGISISSSPANGLWFPQVGEIYSGSATMELNFGNPPYSANSYTDGAGYGNFSYAVPSGYYSLNTKNLANFG